MQFVKTEIPDVIIIEPRLLGDERGFFMETFHEARFAAVGIPTVFVQDNHSGSRQGTLRGLHYQIRQPQGKLVRVISGEIFDVAVDIRRSSPTFGKWVGAILSSQNKHMIWVPTGFAHGFYVLSEWAELVYKASDYYAPEFERTLLWNDPTVGVAWPSLHTTLELQNGANSQPVAPLLSPKDLNGLPLNQLELFD